MKSEIREKISPIVPGVIIAATVGFAASFLSEHYGAPAMLFALLLGMALNFLYDDEKCACGIDFAATSILRIGVAMLGFRIVLADVVALGWHPLFLTLFAITSTIVFGVIAARAMGLSSQFGTLTGGAVAICGASAAMAISAVLPNDTNKEQNTVFTIVGVTTLSTLAMVFYPIISNLLGLTEAEAGIFFGGTIHDVAQVVGAGFSVSTEAGDLATLTKLMRVSMLMPVVLVIALAFRQRGESGGKKPPILPMFLIGFVGIVLINSFITIPSNISEGLTSFSRTCLITAIAAIGLKSDLRKLSQVGLKPVLLMVAQTVWLAGVVLICIWMVE